MRKKKKNYLKIIIGLLIILVVLLVIIIILSKKNNNENESPVVVLNLTDEQKREVADAEKQAKIEMLSKMSEQKRLEYYVTEFFKNIENRKFRNIYPVLNDEFKKNYFNTEEAFMDYGKEFFPKELATKYLNFERLGNTYVMEVTVIDILSNDKNNSFDMYVVVKENGIYDYELSFSVDRPIKFYESDEEEE